MNKNLKHIKENSAYIDAEQLITIKMTKTKQIYCEFKGMDNLEWHGEIQKIYLNKKGEAIGYDVYIY